MILFIHIKPSVQAHILRMLNIVTWLAGLGEKRAKRWHFRKNSIFCVWRFHPQMKNLKTLGLNAHWIGWKILSTNQIAPFSVTCNSETLGLTCRQSFSSDRMAVSQSWLIQNTRVCRIRGDRFFMGQDWKPYTICPFEVVGFNRRK